MVHLSLDARGDACSLPQLVEKTSKRTRVRAVVLSLLAACALVWCFVASTEASTEQLPEEHGGFTPVFIPDWASEVVSRRTAECDGLCVTEDQQTEENKLKGQFIIISIDHLTDPDKPRLKDEKLGWMVWYLFLIVYMFAGLAIVCDEFFVPALEAFVDAFGISMDVAGATFMAAGGSMPELFTSLFSVMQSQGEIGFAAIVGSAVFNVLFVIAVCAIFSSEVLVLTGWPLARDCAFYIIALLTVVIVFGVSSKGEIQAWEAIILLIEYILYCSFMKVNGWCQDTVNQLISGKNSKVAPLEVHVQGTAEEAQQPEGGAPAERHEGRLFSKVSNSSGTRTLTMPGMFRKGIVQLLTQNAFLYETAGIAAVTQIKGSLEDTFNELDQDNDGFLSAQEIKMLLENMGLKHNEAAVNTALRRITRSADGTVSFDAFKKWYIASEARIEIEVRRVFDHFDKDQSNSIDRTEIGEVMKSLGHRPSEQQINDLMEELQQIQPEIDPEEENGGRDVKVQEAGDGEEITKTPEVVKPQDPNAISFEQFEAWYTKSLFYQGKQKQHKAEEDAENCALSLDPPEGDSKSALFWYVFTYPLVAVLYITLPDVRQEKFQRNYKIAILEFVLSLFWIGAFSLLLFECTVVISNTMRIPTAVSAITVLAAGTSIPDLFSSYIVARNGEGDMAVSSSIGSNIFDVTVGLPLPWLLFNLIKGETVKVDNNSLIFSVLLLVVMLLAVISTIVLMKWRMTKSMGIVMLVLYIVFLTQNLCDQLLPEGSGGKFSDF